MLEWWQQGSRPSESLSLFVLLPELMALWVQEPETWERGEGQVYPEGLEDREDQ